MKYKKLKYIFTNNTIKTFQFQSRIYYIYLCIINIRIMKNMYKKIQLLT